MTLAIRQLCLSKHALVVQLQQLPASASTRDATIRDAVTIKAAAVDISLHALLQAACRPFSLNTQGKSAPQCADEAALMLAWNVLTAPHACTSLPQPAKQCLQQSTVFQICCRALLQISCSRSKQATAPDPTQEARGPSVAKALALHRIEELTWIDLAWAVANVTQLAAGDALEWQAQSLRHLQSESTCLACREPQASMRQVKGCHPR